ncbi:MAG: type II toxin-antitoxin system Phd/YefM family antitoxin [Myxococcales bacterium]|nr:type II toxin-antitoxin system Phd/YefM family antitoxin [Myxococcales bacterium]
MNAIAAAKFKATCLAVLDRVEQTGEPVLVTKRGRPVAKIVPVAPEGTRHPQDALRGSVTFLGDVLSPALPPEAWDALRRDGADPLVDARPEPQADVRAAGGGDRRARERSDGLRKPRKTLPVKGAGA